MIFTVVSVGVMFITNSLVRFLVGVNDQDLVPRAERNFFFLKDGEWTRLSVREIKRLFDWAEGVTITIPQAATLIIAVGAVMGLFTF